MEFIHFVIFFFQKGIGRVGFDAHILNRKRKAVTEERLSVTTKFLILNITHEKGTLQGWCQKQKGTQIYETFL